MVSAADYTDLGFVKVKGTVLDRDYILGNLDEGRIFVIPTCSVFRFLLCLICVAFLTGQNRILS